MATFGIYHCLTSPPHAGNQGVCYFFQHFSSFQHQGRLQFFPGKINHPALPDGILEVGPQMPTLIETGTSANFKLVEGLPESIRVMIKPPKETTYYTCDHAGTYKKKTSNEPPLIKLRKTKYSIKHINHNPLELFDMVSSRLPIAIKLWIKNQVDSNMDWKAIKAGLRMTDEDLDTFNLSNVIPKIPAGLIISYQDVQNIILTRMNSLARKHF
ncbi:hypothetical protein BDF14DRAFT_1884893 [Spinellus fusiger]|nr:hypothetical protein BDF14DRAFT_1884893 [Spinellus fusiger]